MTQRGGGGDRTLEDARAVEGLGRVRPWESSPWRRSRCGPDLHSEGYYRRLFDCSSRGDRYGEGASLGSLGTSPIFAATTTRRRGSTGVPNHRARDRGPPSEGRRWATSGSSPTSAANTTRRRGCTGSPRHPAGGGDRHGEATSLGNLGRRLLARRIRRGERLLSESWPSTEVGDRLGERNR